MAENGTSVKTQRRSEWIMMLTFLMASLLTGQQPWRNKEPKVLLPVYLEREREHTVTTDNITLEAMHISGDHQHHRKCNKLHVLSVKKWKSVALDNQFLMSPAFIYSFYSFNRAHFHEPHRNFSTLSHYFMGVYTPFTPGTSNGSQEMAEENNFQNYIVSPL